MASVTRTYLVDDLNGSAEGVETVRFALDGTNYEIDLSTSNAGRLREKLARFVDAASPAKAARAVPARRGRRGRDGSVSATPTRSNRDQVQAIREWAKAAGYEVSSRGRISKVIRDAFAAAQ